MMIIHLTDKLRKKLKAGTLTNVEKETKPQLRWYGNVFTVKRVQYVLVTNAKSLYSVVMYGRVKQQVYLPVPTYSIKSVAPALGFNWRQKEVGAFESMTLYWDYLKTGDKSALQKAIDYNEDDCKAMYEVDKKLCGVFSVKEQI